MSIIADIGQGNKDCLLISSSQWFDNILIYYEDINDGHWKLHRAIFDIRVPFLMDGEARKIAEEMMINEEKNDPQVVTVNQEINKTSLMKTFKRRKFASSLPESELKNLSFIKERFSAMQESVEFKNHFNFVPNSRDFMNNNINSRKARETFLSVQDYPCTFIDSKNETDSFTVSEISGRKYIIPPQCRYVNSDIYDIESIFQNVTFDFVVVDPPWRNKHVRRKKRHRGISHSYDTMDVSEILSIPLSSVLSRNSFVFIWITNNARIIEEFLNGLQRWDLEIVATWYWIKITKAGDPVVSLNSFSNKGKLPYEKILVTRRKKTKEENGKSKSLSEEKDDNIQCQIENLVFCSVPSSIHSHKPPLKEILAHYFPMSTSSNCLELFARCITPGWTCLGNEVFRFQNLDLLLKKTEPALEATK